MSSIPPQLPPAKQSGISPASVRTSASKRATVQSSPFGNNLAEWILRGRDLETMGAMKFCAKFASDIPEEQRDCVNAAETYLAYNRWSRFN